MPFYQRVKQFLYSIKPINKSENIDFIGDIHGYYNELKSLLLKLEYRKEEKIWQHKSRKALFLGDFINKGPDSLKVIKHIKRMVDNGKAYAILGNHELYFLEYYYSKKHNKKTRLRQSQQRQIKKILKKFETAEEIDLYADWLSSLPFYYKFKKARAVHAYWSDKNIKVINRRTKNKKLKYRDIKEIFKQKSKFSKAVWQTTKGVEFRIPKKIIKENKNILQSNFRIKWWIDYKSKTFNEISFDSRITLPDIQIKKKYVRSYDIYNISMPPIFFGHYCLTKHKHIQEVNICCLDGCIAGGGKNIKAYRWSGENQLSKEKLFKNNKFYKK